MPTPRRKPDPRVNDVVDANRRISRPGETKGTIEDARFEDAVERGLTAIHGTPAAPPLDTEADRRRHDTDPEHDE